MSRYVFNGKEQRAYVRLDADLTVMLKFSGNKSDKTYTATTKNISHGGLCLEVPHNHKELLEKLQSTRKKPRIHLNIAILNKDLEFSAKPAWINCRFDYVRKANTKKPAFLMGLAFNKLPEVARKQIHNYIANEFIKRYGRDDRSKESET